MENPSTMWRFFWHILKFCSRIYIFSFGIHIYKKSFDGTRFTGPAKNSCNSSRNFYLPFYFICRIDLSCASRVWEMQSGSCQRSVWVSCVVSQIAEAKVSNFILDSRAKLGPLILKLAAYPSSRRHKLHGERARIHKFTPLKRGALIKFTFIFLKRITTPQMLNHRKLEGFIY